MSVPAVYKAINAVQSELATTGISKDRKNQQQGYAFRGIDDCYGAIAPLLAKHGLVIIPRGQSRSVTERETKAGGALFYTTVDVEFDFVAVEDGSKHTAKMFGEAMDSGDKSTNKAQSAAYKYLCLQTFCIPTEGDNDADAVTHEVAARPPARQDSKQPSSPSDEPKTRQKSTTAQGTSSQKLKDRMIAVLITENKYEQAAVEDYAVKSGILKEGQRVTDWPEDKLPKNAGEMAKLTKRIAWFLQGMSVDEIEAEEAKPLQAIEWRDELAPYGKNKGTRLGDLDDKDLEYFVEKFQVDESKKPEWVEKDKKLRAALDAAKLEKGW